MDFSPLQREALDKVHRWLERGSEQVFHLFGFAGTGKTTLAKYFAESVRGEVYFAAYTGKASYVLRTKGCTGATTIHSLIYHTRDRSKSRLLQLQKQLNLLLEELGDAPNKDDHPRVIHFRAEIKKEMDQSDQPFFVLNMDSPLHHAKLLIIDECSMVDNKMGEDLLSFGCKVLVLGDPAQLPPVAGSGYFTEDVTPDVMLTEIHRQAEESPIIRMATQVRNQQPLTLGDYGKGCRVIDHNLEPEETLSFDQILVGRNLTRFGGNLKVRRLLGHEDPYPIPGDRLVCLKNNHDLGLLNGAIFYVHDVNGVMDGKIFMDVLQEHGGNQTVEVGAHSQYFVEQGWKPAWYENSEAHSFDYGYALTVHKSQGSQWDKVCLVDESFCFRKDRWRWLYTGITRAAEELTIIRK